jgi:C4-dicarboxylate-specific signal transduction histidine kinase
LRKIRTNQDPDDLERKFYRPDTEKKDFNIKDAIDQAPAFIAPAFRFHSTAVELDVYPGLTVFGYPKEYAQVLLNILANARDAFKARETEKPKEILKLKWDNVDLTHGFILVEDGMAKTNK